MLEEAIGGYLAVGILSLGLSFLFTSGHIPSVVTRARAAFVITVIALLILWPLAIIGAITKGGDN